MTAAARPITATSIDIGDDTASVARGIYEGRRRRDETFAEHSSLFGEPAWDLLLDLYVSGAENRRISIMDGCLGSANPTTTALRHLRKLERAGLVQRRQDPADGRRQWLVLTDPGRHLMDRFLKGFESRRRLVE